VPEKTYGLFAGLDIGTEKIYCTVGGLSYEQKDGGESSWDVSMLGFGQHAAKGTSLQGITNIDFLEDAILNAVYAAEEAAKRNIKEVYVNIPANLVKACTVQTEISISGQTSVQSMHLRKLFSLSKNFQIPDSQHVIHMWPLAYKLDDISNIRDPIGMVGQTLSALCYIVTAPKSYIANITQCVGRCNLDIAGFVSDTYADGLSCLVEDEAELGALLIDIGGRVTQIACFIHGNLVWMSYIPLGGFHITSDLARVLATTIPQAERIKMLYGSLSDSTHDSAEQVSFSQLASKYASTIEYVPRGTVLEIIKARLDDIFDGVVETIGHMPANIDRVALQKVIFTGGACGFHGFAEFAEKKLGVNVRVASQNGILGVERVLNSLTLSTSAGLLHYAANEYMGNSERTDKKPLNFWQKISLWLSEHV
jgi:cell division protein FtsA